MSFEPLTMVYPPGLWGDKREGGAGGGKRAFRPGQTGGVALCRSECALRFEKIFESWLYRSIHVTLRKSADRIG